MTIDLLVGMFLKAQGAASAAVLLVMLLRAPARRLFEGSLTPLVAHFAERRNLKPDEVKRLKKLLEEMDDGD